MARPVFLPHRKQCFELFFLLPVGALTGGRWYVGLPESRGNVFSPAGCKQKQISDTALQSGFQETTRNIRAVLIDDILAEYTLLHFPSSGTLDNVSSCPWWSRLWKHAAQPGLGAVGVQITLTALWWRYRRFPVKQPGMGLDSYLSYTLDSATISEDSCFKHIQTQLHSLHSLV